MHGGTHSCIFQNFRYAAFLKNLVGQHPKTFNNFGEIGYAPLVLILIGRNQFLIHKDEFREHLEHFPRLT